MTRISGGNRPSHLFTLAELQQLDAWQHGASPTVVAQSLGVSLSAVHNWLRILNMTRDGKPKQYRIDKGSARCGRCEILLKYVVHNAAGICELCIDELAVLQEVTARVKYSDAKLAVYEMMAI